MIVLGSVGIMGLLLSIGFLAYLPLRLRYLVRISDCVFPACATVWFGLGLWWSPVVLFTAEDEGTEDVCEPGGVRDSDVAV